MLYNQQYVCKLHGYILLAIFREIHQVQGFIDFDRGKFGLTRLSPQTDEVYRQR